MLPFHLDMLLPFHLDMPLPFLGGSVAAAASSRKQNDGEDEPSSIYCDKPGRSIRCVRFF